MPFGGVCVFFRCCVGGGTCWQDKFSFVCWKKKWDEKARERKGFWNNEGKSLFADA
jgi:hypothetical protein